MSVRGMGAGFALVPLADVRFANVAELRESTQYVRLRALRKQRSCSHALRCSRAQSVRVTEVIKTVSSVILDSFVKRGKFRSTCLPPSNREPMMSPAIAPSIVILLSCHIIVQ